MVLIYLALLTFNEYMAFRVVIKWGKGAQTHANRLLAPQSDRDAGQPRTVVDLTQHDLVHFRPHEIITAWPVSTFSYTKVNFVIHFARSLRDLILCSLKRKLQLINLFSFNWYVQHRYIWDFFILQQCTFWYSYFARNLITKL